MIERFGILLALFALAGGAFASGAALAVDARTVSSTVPLEACGLTETSPLACANPIYGKRKNGAIGLPVGSC